MKAKIKDLIKNSDFLKCSFNELCEINKLLRHKLIQIDSEINKRSKEIQKHISEKIYYKNLKA
jgi:hypothetical protein